MAQPRGTPILRGRGPERATGAPPRSGCVVGSEVSARGDSGPAGRLRPARRARAVALTRGRPARRRRRRRPRWPAGSGAAGGRAGTRWRRRAPVARRSPRRPARCARPARRPPRPPLAPLARRPCAAPPAVTRATGVSGRSQALKAAGVRSRARTAQAAAHRAAAGSVGATVGAHRGAAGTRAGGPGGAGAGVVLVGQAGGLANGAGARAAVPAISGCGPALAPDGPLSFCKDRFDVPGPAGGRCCRDWRCHCRWAASGDSFRGRSGSLRVLAWRWGAPAVPISSSRSTGMSSDSCGPVGATGAGDPGGVAAGNAAVPGPVASGCLPPAQRPLSAPGDDVRPADHARGVVVLTRWHRGWRGPLRAAAGAGSDSSASSAVGCQEAGSRRSRREELLEVGEEAAEVVEVGGAATARAVAGDDLQVALLHERLLVAVQHLRADPRAPAHLAQAGIRQGVRPAVGEDVADEPHLLGDEGQLGPVVVEGGGDGGDAPGQDGGAEAGEEAVAGVRVGVRRRRRRSGRSVEPTRPGRCAGVAGVAGGDRERAGRRSSRRGAARRAGER